MAGGLVFGMVLAGAGIAFAAGPGSGNGSGSGTGSGTTPPSANPNTTPAGHGHHAGHMGGPFGKLGLGGRVLYGQATIQTPSGATKTIDFQVGTVNSVSSTSITVQSGPNNSHTQQYTVEPSTIVDAQAGGINAVKQGDKVVVLAEDNGSGNPTAMDIRDQTQMKDSRQGFGFGAPSNQNAGNQNAGNPPASTSSAFDQLG